MRDGLGIRLMQQIGVNVAFISGGKEGASAHRANQLGLQHCYLQIKNKPKKLKELQKSLNLSKYNTLYLGDDLNDLTVRGQVSLLVSTADAVVELKRKSDKVLRSKGGFGAVRELSEDILKAKGKWSNLTRLGWYDYND